MAWDAWTAAKINLMSVGSLNEGLAVKSCFRLLDTGLEEGPTRIITKIKQGLLDGKNAYELDKLSSVMVREDSGENLINVVDIDFETTDQPFQCFGSRLLEVVRSHQQQKVMNGSVKRSVFISSKKHTILVFKSL